jgi:hypothetical protein
MALGVQLTLGAARSEVISRLGYQSRGASTSRLTGLIDSFINRAIRTLVFEVDWIELKHELVIPLVTGQNRYEFPDEVEIGGIWKFVVRDADECEYDLEGGILNSQDAPGLPGDETLRAVTGQPAIWRIIDREIELTPAPTDTYVSLKIGYIRRVTKLTRDEDVLPFDSEAIIRQAEHYGRVHFALPGIGEFKEDFARYLFRIKSQQTEGRVFNAGGRKSHYVTRSKKVYRDSSNTAGRNVVWSPDWNPW